jgi:hypothetical protein
MAAVAITGCGGKAPSAPSSSAAAGSPSNGGPALSAGGSGASGDGSVSGASAAGTGAAGTGAAGTGAAGTGAAGTGATGVFACPPEQWDCSSLGSGCVVNVSDGVMPAGCSCDLSRPRTADDCAPDETLVCLNATGGANHVQCSCVPIDQVYMGAGDLADPGVTPTCYQTCERLFPQGKYDQHEAPGCYKEFSETTCDDAGKCSDKGFSDDELRRQGVECTCSPILP